MQCYDSAFNRIVGLNPQPTLSNNTAIFDSTQCAQLQSNSVKYILMGYTAVGVFPYFTFGERGAGTIGKYSTCIGEMCVASNDDSYAEGLSTEASGVGAHAEGNGANASGGYSHAEGYDTKASGTQAHSEGHNSIASGSIAHAEGFDTTASGYASHAQNFYTKASSNYQTALGKYNVEDNASTYAVIIGNGSADNARSNALTVKWNGDVKSSGDIEDGSGNVLSDKADTTAIPTKTSDLNNDSRFISADGSGNVSLSGSITVEGHNSEIGYRPTRATGSYSLASGTSWTTVPSSGLARTTLSQGVWIIQAQAIFASNSTGWRALRIYDVTTSENIGRSGVTQPAVNGATTNLTTMAIISLTASNAFTLQITQNSGAARNVDLTFDAVRIA